MKENKDILNPTNDYVFSMIFGKKGNEDITRDFIEKATGIRYEDINLESTPILERNLLENKKGVLDVKVVANEINNIDIEMQVTKSEYIADRVLWYWAKMYSTSIEKGKTYDNTKRAICILIADFKIEKLKEIKEFKTKWNIREEKHQNIILTNKLEIIIIELDKIEESISENTLDIELAKWCKFIKSPREVSDSIMKENENIKKAKEELEKISESEYDRRMAELREKAILDDLAYIKTGYNEGIRDGIEQGIKQGIKEGIRKGTLEEKKNIAKHMLKEKMDVEVVCKITGLDKEEIEKMQI